METNTREEIEINLMEILYVLKEQIWIIAVSTLGLAVLVGMYCSFFVTPIYSSRSQLYILNKSTNNANASYQELQASTQLTQDYLILVKSRPVVNQVIENLELDTDYEAMISYIQVSNPNNTRILEIKVNYPDAFLAKQIADEFAIVSTEQIAVIMATEKPAIVEEGYLPKNPTSPNTTRNMILGALIGLLVSAGIIVVLHLMDDTIKTTEDIEKYLGLSTLAMIPIEAGSQKATELTKKKRKKAQGLEKKGLR